MDGYLKRRLSNPAYGGSSAARLDENCVYERCVKQARTDAHPLQWVRHEASASKKLYRATDKAEKETKTEDGDKKKKKKNKKTKKEGDKSSSSSSDSDSGGERGPCWKGYKKKKGMADYADGSCVKA